MKYVQLPHNAISIGPQLSAVYLYVIDMGPPFYMNTLCLQPVLHNGLRLIQACTTTKVGGLMFLPQHTTSSSAGVPL